MIKNYTNLSPQICGYIRRSTLCDDDYVKFIQIINEKKLFQTPNLEVTNLIYYKIDMLLLEFHLNYSFKGKTITRERVRLKIRMLYDKIRECYSDHFNNIRLNSTKKDSIISMSEIKKYMGIISESGYPHAVLTYLHHSTLEDCKIEKILNEYSENYLEDMYFDFVNSFSEQSGIPTYVVIIFTIKLKEKLNQKLKEIISKNDSITPVKLKNYLSQIVGDTRLNIYYGKSKEHDISDWCSKVRRKTMDNLIRNIKSDI